MADPARAQRTPQGRGDVVLADHLGEGLRAVTTVQSGGHPYRLVETTDVLFPVGDRRGLWREGAPRAAPPVAAFFKADHGMLTACRRPRTMPADRSASC